MFVTYFAYYVFFLLCILLLPLLADAVHACLAVEPYLIYSMLQSTVVAKCFTFVVLLFWQPYIDLANCYVTGKNSELETSIQTNIEKFQAVSTLLTPTSMRS